MLKIISVICCCIISCNCYTQVSTKTDSTKTATPERYVAAKNTKTDLSIYPNPAKNKVTLQVKQFDPGMAIVRLMDIKGKIIKEDNRLLTNGTEDIVMFLMLKAGIYFIQVSQAGKVVRKKLAIL
jgi:Secretion system C-terminal sorting domain